MKRWVNRRHVRARWAAALAAVALASAVEAEEVLRIWVAEVRDPIRLSGTDLAVVDPAGTLVFKPGRAVEVAPAADGISIDGDVVEASPLRLISRGGIQVGGLHVDNEVELVYDTSGPARRLLVVHTVPVETYVAATVSAEMPSAWPIEALKAQAVATRTFAVFKRFRAEDKPFHMGAGVLDQVYAGSGAIKGPAREAAELTRGEVVTYKRRPIRAYFHSCCSGQTESSLEGWGQSLAYLPGTRCGFDQDCPAARYQARVPLRDLAAALRGVKLRVHRIDAVRVVSRSSTGRVSKLTLDTDGGRVDLSGEDLRRLVGYGLVKSRLFDARIVGDVLEVEGRGSGHGVGMCQWGARGMALAGKGYREILLHYYPGTRVTRMY